MPHELQVSYNDVERLIDQATCQFQHEFRPDVIVAISGGGDIPARILRTALGSPTLPIYHVGVRSYSDTKIGKQQEEVEVYQWIEPDTLQEWKQNQTRILIVDDIIDSNKTMDYVMKRLRQEIDGPENKMDIFCLYDKDRQSSSQRQPDWRTLTDKTVICHTVKGDCWVVMPWE